MKYYIIDAFTDEQFKGNPAGVFIMDKTIDGNLMQKIAAEINLPETAFLTRNGAKYDLRWFTPKTEVKLCGHGTLASAFVLKNFYDKKAETLEFSTLSGTLTVNFDGKIYNVNMPAFHSKKIEPTSDMSKAIGGIYIAEAWESTERQLLLRLETEEQVKKAKPAAELLEKLNYTEVCITAKAEKTDIVSRLFAPKLGVLEDPVTGAAHCMLIPYWADKLHKDYITAYQSSERGGYLYCRNLHDRIVVGGNAVLIAEGSFNV